MERFFKRLNVLCLALAMVLVLGGQIWAQTPPNPPDEPDDPPPMMQPGGGMGMGHGGMFGMGPGGVARRMGPKGFERGFDKCNLDPAEKKKIAAIRTTAEAYKNLADLYREQGKPEEAIVQLKKILTLCDSITDQNLKGKLIKQISHVYVEIGKLYLDQNKTAEAEAILNEGFDKIKKDAPEAASRIMLQLGNMMRKAGKTAEAEKAFQRVIELNSASLAPEPKK